MSEHHIGTVEATFTIGGPETMHTGEAFAQARKGMGVTQAQLAKTLNTSPAAVAMQEGRDNWRIRTLEKYLEGIGLSMAKLIEISDLADRPKSARIWTTRSGWRGRFKGETFDAADLLSIRNKAVRKGARYIRIGDVTLLPEQISCIEI